MARTLTFNLDGNDKQLVAALTRAQKELKQTGEAAEATGKKTKAGLDIKGALAGVAVLGGAKFAIDEAEQAQQTLARTQAVIKSTGNAAGVSAAQQDDYVQALSKTAAIDDEVIAGGANLLRTFTNIKGQAFQPALEAAVNLSAAMGTDLQSSIVQVGKALNDPIKGVTALQRVGVSFTAQQKEQIKTMVQAGDTAGAQKLILAELSKEFAGSAAAMATDSARAKVAIGNAAESIGGALAPAMQKGASALGFLSDEFSGLPQPVQTGMLALGTAVVIGPKIADGFRKARTSVSNLAESISGMGALSIPAAAGTIGLGAAAWAFAHDAQEAAERSRNLKDAIKALRDEAETTGKSVTEVFSDKTLPEFVAKNHDVMDQLGISAGELRVAVNGTHKEWTSFLDSQVLGLGVLKKNAQASNELRNPIRDLRAALTGARSETKKLSDAETELQGQQPKTGESTEALTKKWNEHAEAIGKVNAETDKLLSAAFSEFQSNEKYEQSVSSVTEAQAELNLIRKTGDQSKIRDAEAKLTDAIENQVQAKGDQAQATAKANGKELTGVELARIQQAELLGLQKRTGDYSDSLGLLVIRLQQVEDHAKGARDALREMENPAAPSPGTPQSGSAIPPSRDPDAGPRRSRTRSTETEPTKTTRNLGTGTNLIIQGDLVVGGKHGAKQMDAALRRHEQRQAREVAVS